MTGFRFQLGQGSQEFFVLKTIYEPLRKKGDAKKFYSNFYSLGYSILGDIGFTKPVQKDTVM